MDELHKLKGGDPLVWPSLAQKRLTAPAGSLPASGSGESEAAPDQTRDKNPTSAPPFGGQGTGALDQLEEYLERKAARYEEVARSEPRMCSDEDADVLLKHAAESRVQLAALVELRRAPRPQSEGQSVRCPACQNDDAGTITELLCCGKCDRLWAPESGGASVPPNESGMATGGNRADSDKGA